MIHIPLIHSFNGSVFTRLCTHHHSLTLDYFFFATPKRISIPICCQFQFSSVQFLCCVRLFVTQWTTARQASLSITNSQSLLKLMSIESVLHSNHLILFWPLLLPPSIFPSIRIFSSSSHQVDKVLEFQLQHQSFQ